MLTPQGNRFLTELLRPQLGIISRHDCQPSTLPHVRVSIPLRGVPARGVVTCLGEWRRPHQDLGVCVITGMRGQQPSCCHAFSPIKYATTAMPKALSIEALRLVYRALSACWWNAR
ncbi:hypothetical protein NGA_2049820 [Nannochloropsis gaditana CCMP526]|uniref:uncharacterized protein n=1 Tax=Nannochloropsis gaditana (strain CCMP526) TaxID=1093141 RepID=UPI00029F5A23|nr:hypothetical protein NGA_2049820 [Nannochloropsis gaditana CCMP526]XP_005854648.1 hypothetical protein NGA_2049810 [Nannochloropsis gaditana CCMP526]EKU21712.1 hypothetical protein NGA_2049810 [Nannochloropsis gaditana CCMP526]EKU23414.1 hypothetical protein NGA_2049820 [Nannochloropsis gaditana CCMP526]|eukprot:XP_005852418.1 hypothetical protein NGA_2049820 [Nannochloropsis gaditana CCMP526]